MSNLTNDSLACYGIELKLHILHPIDSLDNLKSAEEYAKDICHLIADECCNVNALCLYDVVDAKRSF